jgi:phosphoglycerate dehydrogenase-like enzyme
MTQPPASIDAILASIRARVTGPDEDPANPPPAPADAPAVRLDNVVVTPAAAATTLDELIRSLLAPQIKAWLDAHMPEIVEKLAREEIKRLTGKL